MGDKRMFRRQTSKSLLDKDPNNSPNVSLINLFTN